MKHKKVAASYTIPFMVINQTILNNNRSTYEDCGLHFSGGNNAEPNFRTRKNWKLENDLSFVKYVRSPEEW